MTESEEKLYIQQAQAGSSTAFEKLLALHEHKLFSLALSMTGGNRAQADDLYQDAVIKAFVNIRSFRGQSSFKTWIWTIVRHEFINAVTSRKRHGEVQFEEVHDVDHASHNHTDDDIAKEQRIENLRKLVAMLSPEYQEAITLCEFQELSLEEAAELAGINKNNMKVRIFRAREKLYELAMKHEHLFF